MTQLPIFDRVQYLPEAPTDDGVQMDPQQIYDLRPEATTLYEAECDSLARSEEQETFRSFTAVKNVVFRSCSMPFKAVCIREGECGEGRTELIVVCPYCHSEAISATAGDRCSSLDRGAPRCLDVFVQVQCRNPDCGKTSTLAIGTDECGRATVVVYTAEGGEK